MKTLNIGVIGAGGISDVHFHAYAKNEQANIYAISDLNELRAKEKADKYGAQKVYTDYHELLADPVVDAVSVCTWNNLHAPIVIDALHAGKHVLVEKPLCTTLEDAYKIQEAVKKTGKILQVGFVRRFGENTQLLKKFIDNGDFGEIYYAKASCIRRLGNPGGWFADKERSGGGPLIDIGVHVIDLCWYLMGRPKVKSVSGNTYNQLGNRANVKHLSFYKAADYDSEKNTVEDMANAVIRFENGASLMVDVSFTLHAKKDEITAKIYGDKGGAEIEPELFIVSEKHDTILNISPQVDNATFDFEIGFQNEINAFVDSCLNGTPVISPVEDGVEIMKILTGIYESSEKGCEIQFTPVAAN
ncbi:Gfo/Idh/MocA family protein [Heyndrickxia sporothermodurans]